MALVELAKFYNGFEAGLARGRLEAEGIESHLFDFNTAMEGIGFLVPVRLMVPEADAARARRILAQPGDASA